MSYEDHFNSIVKKLRSEAQSIKSKLRAQNIDRDKEWKLENQLVKLQNTIAQFDTKKVKPRKLSNGSVVNVFILDAFLKKLKQFDHELVETSDGLELRYWSKKHPEHSKGKMIFYALDRYLLFEIPFLEESYRVVKLEKALA
ncbi:hypothetical protein FCT18_17155 [Lysinibacillus sphaericus]|uniref:Uncharacterized protein n=1 Tax=Lysinibacillus sphaericus TaxID=1421 RepID=A0A2S0JWX9_LYSSH|nr:hypothetical protein [Lysinibacillus sphaericus]AVK95591.1 hypothetical protein LS41612_04530 [Lysinibacillus sphaericus]MED4546488.1 hypothetical protein [Lysinibacillus sphaericus]TKI17657.1 hypothetical protein FCT18_17155 [Lysinibacillus sphaericus]SUV18715.1 Uncharacterised protein [Lysinibacillus sphaericus]GEC84483.1 hypothetical protein LSP03_42260 [Lysinibacillus sphaericus]